MSEIKFTEVFKVSRPVAEISRNGQFLAYILSNRCFVREIKTLEIVHIFLCVDNIETIKWSYDSCYLLCGLFKRGTIQVWSLEEPEWTCRIDEGSLGLINICWSPDSRHILTTSKFHLRITVWSLVTKSVSYLKYAKPANPGLSFRPDGKYLALAERRDCHDHISIVVCSTWQLVKNFETATNDLAGIAWSSDGTLICVWESLAEDYKILIYTLDGNCFASYSAYSMALGIKSMAWSSTGQFIAVGSYDQKVRILNRYTFKVCAEFGFPVKVANSVVIYKEHTASPELKSDLSLIYTKTKYEVITERPIIIDANPLDYTKPNPKHGVGILKFSSDSQYLASVNDNMPNAVWVWDMEQYDVTIVLMHSHPVKCIAWDPVHTRLAICTETNNVFLWSPSGCLVAEVPVPYQGNFKIQIIKWHPLGDKLLLISKENTCLCYLNS